MKTTFSLITIAALGLTSATALAGGVSEGFDGGPANEGNWTFGFVNTFPAAGGNPGSYLRVEGLDTFAPMLRTQGTSAFTGNYRTAGVTGMNVDLNTFAVDFGADGRPNTLMLIHDPGTPGDPLDDTAAYYLGPNVPLEGTGWISYHFDVPSAETTLPAGWLLLNLGDSGAPPLHTWDQVIQDVDKVQFFYGDPTFFFIFQQWTLGADNIELLVEPTCPDTDGDGDVDVDDLNAVIINWGACPGGCATDFNGDERTDVNDLVEVITGWGACR